MLSNKTFGTCFPAGSKVLMANQAWKNIEEVQVGELLFSVDGLAECVEEHVTFLGDRKMISFSDKSLFWSEEHAFWAKSDNKEWWWSYNPNRIIYEIEIGLLGGVKNTSSIINTLSNLEFAHTDGWKKADVVVDQTGIYNEKTPLFLPMTTGAPIVVNGYLVMSQLNEFRYDYTKIVWDNIILQFKEKIEF
jgi:hypothetical protein